MFNLSPVSQDQKAVVLSGRIPLDWRADSQGLTVLGCLVIPWNVHVSLEMLKTKLTIEDCQDGRIVWEVESDLVGGERPVAPKPVPEGGARAPQLPRSWPAGRALSK